MKNFVALFVICAFTCAFMTTGCSEPKKVTPPAPVKGKEDPKDGKKVDEKKVDEKKVDEKKVDEKKVDEKKVDEKKVDEKK